MLWRPTKNVICWIPIIQLAFMYLCRVLILSLIYCNLYERKSKLLSLQSERSAYLSNCKKNYWIAILSSFHIWQEKNPSVSCTLRYLGIQYLTFYWILIQEKRFGDTGKIKIKMKKWYFVSEIVLTYCKNKLF